ncbi:MAG: VanZ family protein [Acidobacteriota bacterium]
MAWAATVAVAVLCLIPIPQGAEGAALPESDKVVHVLMFGGLALLWWRVLPRRWLLLSVTVTLYGGLMELLQALTPYRSCDLMDFLADGLGVAIALAGAALWARRRRLSL